MHISVDQLFLFPNCLVIEDLPFLGALPCLHMFGIAVLRQHLIRD